MESAGFHNPAVRGARLLQQKKHRLERRCFLVEGPLLVQAAIEAGAEIEQIFVSDEGVASVAGTTLVVPTRGATKVAPSTLAQDATKVAPSTLAQDATKVAPSTLAQDATKVAPSTLAPTFRVDRRTMESLSQTKTPQGIVAVVSFLDHRAAELQQLLPTDGAALILVLPNLSDPGNAGTLIRSAEAFGAGAVCFGPEAVEPYNDKVVRGSMGSLFRVPLVRYADWSELVTAMRAASLQIVAADASGTDVRTVTLPQRAALAVGQERHGLAGIPQADLDMVVALPQAARIESLNAGVAGSLLLYEFARAQGRLSGRH